MVVVVDMVIDYMMGGSRHRTDMNKEGDSAIDTPTFTFMSGRFVDDLRFYHFIIEYRELLAFTFSQICLSFELTDRDVHYCASPQQ